MAGKIPEKFIDDLLARIDIVDVIDARVPLKRAGRDFKACCPFHEEKTPSFTVSQGKQFYHCFGCGAHGSAIGFLMEYERMSFPEAVEELARRAGVEVPHEARATKDQPDVTAPLLEVLAQADQCFRRWLREHPQAAEARDYLKRRGLTGEIAQSFGLGFAPDGWDNLLQAIGTSEPARQALLTAGLIVKKDSGGYYDRFRHRVMFPIHDHRGRLIGFGGRVLGQGEPKYLNSPETPLFHKGRELYGLFRARDAVKRAGRVLVVEGYMDVASLAQYGIDYTVATLGTATTRDHLERLFRHVTEVVFCFDGDRAGREAAWRALENALPVLHEGRQASFLFLPEGEDPDTLVRKEGKEAFEARLGSALSLPDYFFQALAGQVDLARRDAPARIAELAKPLLSNLRSEALKHLMLEHIADKNRLAGASLARILPAGRARPAAARVSGSQPPGGISPVRRAIQLLLQYPAFAGLATAEEVDFLTRLDKPGAELLHNLIDLIRHYPGLSLGAILEHFRGNPHEQHLARLGSEAIPGQPEEHEQLFADILRKLRQEAAALEIERLVNKDRFVGLSEAEKTELKRLLAEKGAVPPA